MKTTLAQELIHVGMDTWWGLSLERIEKTSLGILGLRHGVESLVKFTSVIRSHEEDCQEDWMGIMGCGTSTQWTIMLVG